MALDRDNSIYCHVIGSGPDVVLLHGWGMHSGVWEDVVENLLDHYRVTLIDLPGHGYSRAVGAGHTLSELAAAVLAVAPPRAAWVGWSLRPEHWNCSIRRNATQRDCFSVINAETGLTPMVCAQPIRPPTIKHC